MAFEPRLLSGPEQDVLIGQMIETHRRGIGHPPAWPTDLGEALRTRGFRREIREFLDAARSSTSTPIRCASSAGAWTTPSGWPPRTSGWSTSSCVG
ncbi:hypothetical protein A5N15_05215 [Rothia kristinae]|uniref:Uncharacterized protein n=1 Tax=Rothia kristinae TaxID=37923 RepID=A0A657IUZ3_9MICC|nr:hypothetical protein A5N15_05215 [Rothia kristinae]